MRQGLSEILQCPHCHASLAGASSNNDDHLSCPACRTIYPVRYGIPALVTSASPLHESIERESMRPSRVASSTDATRQRDYWESDLGHREADHPIVAGFSRQRWDHIAKHLPLDRIHTALDVGAGNGFSTAHVPPGIECVATDGSWHMLRRHPGQDLVLADAQALPFRDGSFDLVFCWELLHHVNEPWRVLADMARVSRGWVLLLEPNPLNLAQFLFSIADPEHRWVLRFSRGYLMDQVRRAGLRTEHFERVGLIFPNKTPGWLFPALRALPFRIPLIGISQLVVARKPELR